MELLCYTHNGLELIIQMNINNAFISNTVYPKNCSYCCLLQLYKFHELQLTLLFHRFTRVCVEWLHVNTGRNDSDAHRKGFWDV